MSPRAGPVPDRELADLVRALARAAAARDIDRLRKGAGDESCKH